MNKQLKQIYDEDQLDREKNIHDKKLLENDNKRLVQVEKIINKTKNLTAKDYYHAAMIFQHGHTISHFKKAHDLALKAVNLGDDTARWLAAASLDRLLISKGKAQKYGTQFKFNKNNEWELILPIDPRITDEDRKKWHVPPLKSALKNFKQNLKMPM